MTPLAFDAIRIACYGIIVVGLVKLALLARRGGYRHLAGMCISLAIFHAWLLFEAALTSSGYNTRALRALATPIVVVSAIMVVAGVVELRTYRLPHKKRGDHALSS